MVINFLLYVWFRPFRKTYRAQGCDKNVGLFLIVRRKIARLTVDQKKFIVESVIKTISNITTRRQFKKSFGFDVTIRTVYKNSPWMESWSDREGLHKGRSSWPQRGQFILFWKNKKLQDLTISDESHVYLKGKPNKQNCTEWAFCKPDRIIEQPLHSSKLTIWCGLTSARKFGLHFF